MKSSFDSLIGEYQSDTESVYQTWFINNDERLKAFRTIRSGVKQVVEEIEEGKFINDFKGSSLEVVVSVIAEQKQIFEGAAHAFYWKPKLRIPDIYENEENKRYFGQFLKKCLQNTNEKQLIEEIIKLNKKKIKGLGPAVANILYFLHPTIFPPFNTVIVNGFNLLFNEKIKLGSWTEYLRMRERILDFNISFSSLLSKDLGAIGGLFFEIGSGRQVIIENHELVLKQMEKREKTNRIRHNEVQNDISENNDHSEMQYHLAKVGLSLGYHVWIAKNDHNREWNNRKLGGFPLYQPKLINVPQQVRDTILLIDVLWIDQDDQIVCAFEVEKSTSIFSGILRLYDLSLSMNNLESKLYLVAPDKREKEIKAQLLRPSFQHEQMCNISYILFSDLRCNCDAICKFGTNASILEKISFSI